MRTFRNPGVIGHPSPEGRTAARQPGRADGGFREDLAGRGAARVERTALDSECTRVSPACHPLRGRSPGLETICDPVDSLTVKSVAILLGIFITPCGTTEEILPPGQRSFSDARVHEGFPLALRSSQARHLAALTAPVRRQDPQLPNVLIDRLQCRY